MKKQSLFLAALLWLAALQAHAFCGFYVAGAGAELFNEASQVILVRDGLKTVLTMQNDFKGSVKNFAMVIPVPVVLQRDQIRIADPGIFAYLDKYTGPRLAEYYDENPCYRRYREMPSMSSSGADRAVKSTAPGDDMVKKDYKVTIEAQYAVGEYDIIILSAKDSGGLEHWLKDNGYHIPDNAQEVLTPYVRNNLKFFVVKVNLEKQEQQGFTALRPLQISYENERFMLPIRLGMANATGFQDLIVYAFSRKGRIETANYRTAKIPSNEDVPTRIKSDFGSFYKAVFDRAWKKEDRTSVMLEYAWDLSSTNFVKCDPCATDPMTFAQIKEAGIFWITEGGTNNRGWGSADYEGPLFVTRLHARYDRTNYPEDLAFVNTPNTENFQGRYVIRHPAGGDLTCDEGRRYTSDLRLRQEREERNLTALTGWRADGKTYYDDYDDDSLPLFGGKGGNGGPKLPILFFALGLLAIIFVLPRMLHRLTSRLA